VIMESGSVNVYRVRPGRRGQRRVLVTDQAVTPPASAALSRRVTFVSNQQWASFSLPSLGGIHRSFQSRFQGIFSRAERLPAITPAGTQQPPLSPTNDCGSIHLGTARSHWFVAKSRGGTQLFPTLPSLSDLGVRNAVNEHPESLIRFRLSARGFDA
jgi:hypothetical protein